VICARQVDCHRVQVFKDVFPEVFRKFKDRSQSSGGRIKRGRLALGRMEIHNDAQRSSVLEGGKNHGSITSPLGGCKKKMQETLSHKRFQGMSSDNNQP